MLKEDIAKRAAEVYPDLPAAQAAFIAGMEEMIDQEKKDIDTQALHIFMSKTHNLTLTNDELEEIIIATRGNRIPADMALVSKENLSQWLLKIQEANKFRADAEVDIGWVATSLYNIQKMDLSLPKLMKLLSGSLKPEAIGLDLTRIEAIAAKYAPLTAAKLKAENEALPKKK